MGDSRNADPWLPGGRPILMSVSSLGVRMFFLVCPRCATRIISNKPDGPWLCRTCLDRSLLLGRIGVDPDLAADAPGAA